VNLAKNTIDVGLFTGRRAEQLAFWGRAAGLAFDHMAKLGGGVQQHRFFAHGSIIKVNHARDPLPALPPAGWRELLIARDAIRAPQSLVDPDGNKLTLVPMGNHGVSGIALRLQVNNQAAADRFYRHVLQFDSPGPGVYRGGMSLLLMEEGPVERSEDWRGPGYRYITVQVHDCAAEHAGILARGGKEGQPPLVLGDSVRFSFVRDPDGNFIEISQRASLTGGSL
jgi:lactoylglutathione lyase